VVKISVRVKAGSKQNLVEPAGENEYIVRVKEKAIKGRANEAVIDVLSDFFSIPKRTITIIKGFKRKNKLIAIKNS
jgi:hypothetical protein